MLPLRGRWLVPLGVALFLAGFSWFVWELYNGGAYDPQLDGPDLSFALVVATFYYCLFAFPIWVLLSCYRSGLAYRARLCGCLRHSNSKDEDSIPNPGV